MSRALALDRSERHIGRVVGVTSARVTVELDEGIGSQVRVLPEGAMQLAQIGGYLLFPVGAGASVVGIIVGAFQHEGYEPSPHEGMTLQLAKPRRTLVANLVGTLEAASSADRSAFRHGIAAYPSLESPASVPSRTQLKSILADPLRGRIATPAGDIALHIGRSAIYDEVSVACSLNELFGRHLAIVGNTGSGKSWTTASLIQGCRQRLGADAQERGLSAFHPQFIILDINGEYGRPFGQEPKHRFPDQAYVAGEPFHLPLWTLNLDELIRCFNASEATQQPVLERLVTAARERSRSQDAESVEGSKTEQDLGDTLECLHALLDLCVIRPRAFNIPKGGYDILGRLNACLGRLCEVPDIAREAWLASLVDAVKGLDHKLGDHNAAVIDDGAAAQIRLMVAQTRSGVEEALKQARSGRGPSSTTADKPVAFAPSDLDSPALVGEVLSGMEGEGKVREYIATLRLRIRRTLSDKRWGVFHQGWEQGLVEFFERLLGSEGARREVTVVDCSMLASDVLPFFCSVLGRLLLDLRQHGTPEHRTASPWVLVLEEAHNYLRPWRDYEHPGQWLSRDTFERIAKEGRKFGLSLAIASQRPSEVSDTALSQCSNFIVHRIQNPTDIDYFRRILPAGSREVLDHVSVLSPGEALVLGSAVNVPCRSMVRRPEPPPMSETPEPYHGWSPSSPAFGVSGAVTRWLGSAAAEEGSGDAQDTG